MPIGIGEVPWALLTTWLVIGVRASPNGSRLGVVCLFRGRGAAPRFLSDERQHAHERDESDCEGICEVGHPGLQFEISEGVALR